MHTRELREVVADWAHLRMYFRDLGIDPYAVRFGRGDVAIARSKFEIPSLQLLHERTREHSSCLRTNIFAKEAYGQAQRCVAHLKHLLRHHERSGGFACAMVTLEVNKHAINNA